MPILYLKLAPAQKNVQKANENYCLIYCLKFALKKIRPNLGKTTNYFHAYTFSLKKHKKSDWKGKYNSKKDGKIEPLYN